MSVFVGGTEFPLAQFGGVVPSWLQAMIDAESTNIDVFASPEDFMISPLRESAADVPITFNSPPTFEPRGTGGSDRAFPAIIIGSRQTHGFTPGLTTGIATDPLRFTTAASTPGFIGGRMGRVRFTPITNRQITGVRFGTLPQIVFDEDSPNAAGGDVRVVFGGGGSAVLEP